MRAKIKKKPWVYEKMYYTFVVGGSPYDLLVMPYSAYIGIVRCDDTKPRSGYTIIDIKSGGAFGYKVKTKPEIVRIARVLDYLVRRGPDSEAEKSLAKLMCNDKYRKLMWSIGKKRMERMW